MNQEGKEGWEDRFDEIFKLSEDLVNNGAIINRHSFKDALKSFISSEINQAKREERIRISEQVRDMLNNMATLENEDNAVYEAQHTAYSQALRDCLASLNK